MKNSAKKYTINNEQYVFDREALKSALREVSKRKQITKEKLIDDLARKNVATCDTIKNWQYGKCSPVSVEEIMILADALEIEGMRLFKKCEGEEKVERLTERQLDAAKRIYDIMIWFLDEFNNTDGFNDWWYDFQNAGSENPESDIYDRVLDMRRKIELVISKEYFDLHDHEIYDDFCEFFYEDLDEIYNGKVSYAYRFEAIPDGNPTTWDDYEKAMQHLNQIVERYY